MKKKIILFKILFFISINVFAQNPPTNLTTSNISDISATLSWFDNGCNNNFDLQYRIVGTSNWNNTSTVITNPFNLTSLVGSTNYEWRVKCTSSNLWSNISNFTTLNCNKIINQTISGFSPNPVYGYMQFVYDTLTITNIANCDINLRPEFIITHQDSNIEQGDFTIEWLNPFIGNWVTTPYSVNNNGEAFGFWNYAANDSTGLNVTSGNIQPIIIRVRFMNNNNNPNTTSTPFGTYSAIWTTFEVDNLGNKIQSLATPDTVSLSLVNCNLFIADSISKLDVSCFGENDGYAAVNNIFFGSGTYSYLWTNGATSSSIFNLDQGTYTCTITDDNWSQCSTTSDFIINEPPPISNSEQISDVLCHADSTGSIDITPTGGSFNFNYSWSNGISSQDLINISAGTYSLILSDDNNCTENYTYTINEPSAPISSNITGSDISSCIAQDGSIDLTVYGGTSPYSFMWSNNSTSEDLNNLSSAIYSVIITDNNNCTSNNNILINAFQNLIQIDSLFSPNYSGYNNLCHNDSTALIYSNVSGNNGTINYLWSNGDTTSFIEGLPSGLYTLTVTDSLGCTNSDTLFVNEPLEMFSVFSDDTVTCYNETIYVDILIFGGAQPFEYNWSNSDTNYFTYLGPGNYNIVVTDNNNCQFFDSIHIDNQDSLVIQESLTNISCFGLQDGQALFNVLGGTSPYQFSLDNGMTYQSSNTFYNLSAGNYNAVITDFNGCNNHKQISISQPDSIFTTSSTTDISCYGLCDGSAIVNIAGGSPPFYINWGNSDPSALCQGYHNIIISDNNNCSLTTGVNIFEPNPILANILQNGNILEVTNGYSAYQWYDQSGQPISGEDSNIFIVSNEGEYYVEVTDSNGCTINTNSVLVLINNKEEINLYDRIFPNPSNGKITILSASEIKQIKLYDGVGKLITVFDEKHNTKELNLDLSNFKKGFYLLEITHENYLIQQRIILQ